MTNPAFEIQLLKEIHFDEVITLQREAFPPPFDETLLWSQSDLATHIDLFPEAQWVAIAENKIVGSCSNTLISEANYQHHSDWEATVGGYQIKTFDPNGTTLYGLDISVACAYRNQGIGRAFYECRKRLVVDRKLKRYATGCRLPDFSTSGFENVYEFLELVRMGRKSDRTLSPLLKYDLRIIGAHTNYMEDIESNNCAALLEWEPTLEEQKQNELMRGKLVP